MRDSNRGGSVARGVMFARHVLRACAAALILAASDAGAEQTIEGLPIGADYPYRSPLDLIAGQNSGEIYVINHSAASLERIEIASGKISAALKLEGAPTGLALDREGGRLFVTRGTADGAVDIVDAVSLELIGTIPAGHSPCAPQLAADGKVLYVCNRFDNELAAYDIERREKASSIIVGREPIAAALSSDGARLLVARHLPDQAANSTVVATKLDLVDTVSFEVVASITLPGGATALRDICISPDGRYAYISHNIARFGVPTTQLERGWMNTSALSIIDIASEKLLTSVLLDDLDLGAANPWGVACSDDGARLLVAHSGTHELSVIDRVALHTAIAAAAAGQPISGFASSLEQIPNDLGFVARFRHRITLPGKGPRGLLWQDGAVLVAQYFSDSIARVDLSAATPRTSEFLLGEALEPNRIRRGEIAFHDAGHCFQNWQSCASCHPDARADALNWDLLNDGIGNPKNTRTMLYSHETPPVMITGIRAQAEVAVRAGFRFIQFAVVPEEIAAEVDDYMRALRPLPSPYLVDGGLSPAAERGKQIFASAGCIQCHSGPRHTDGRIHDVGTGPDERGIAKFVTPPLSEVWRTGPWLYKGQAASMHEVFSKFNPDDKHGRTSNLSAAQIDDLALYILSL